MWNCLCRRTGFFLSRPLQDVSVVYFKTAAVAVFSCKRETVYRSCHTFTPRATRYVIRFTTFLIKERFLGVLVRLIFQNRRVIRRLTSAFLDVRGAIVIFKQQLKLKSNHNTVVRETTKTIQTVARPWTTNRHNPLRATWLLRIKFRTRWSGQKSRRAVDWLYWNLSWRPPTPHHHFWYF